MSNARIKLHNLTHTYNKQLSLSSTSKNFLHDINTCGAVQARHLHLNSFDKPHIKKLRSVEIQDV